MFSDGMNKWYDANFFYRHKSRFIKCLKTLVKNLLELYHLYGKEKYSALKRVCIKYAFSLQFHGKNGIKRSLRHSVFAV